MSDSNPSSSSTSREVQRLLDQAKRHYQSGDLVAAAGVCRQVIAADPSCAEALHLLGLLAFRDGRHSEAEDMLRVAISFNSGAPYYYCNLAQVVAATGRYDDALRCCRRSIELKSDEPELHFTAGKVFRAAGRLDEAIAAFDRAIAIRPDYPQAHAHLGMTLLLSGKFDRGWREFEWRLQRPQMHQFTRDFRQPRWNGEDLRGKRILLYSEQALSDVLHFSRYVPLIADRGGRVIVQCQPQLTRLLQGLRGVEQVVSTDQTPPEFDLHCPLLSLPMAFNTTLDALPAETPYLAADPQDVDAWRRRIEGMHLPSNGLKIGLVWAGRSVQQINRRRLLTLNTLAPILQAPWMHYFSLQKGPAAHDLRTSPLGNMVHDMSDSLNDFADTAALIQNLDLVISVDSAVAHLAGALDKPVWVLLPYVPDWRWMLERNDSPWYPSMEIFRQADPVDWKTPMMEIAHNLKRP
jgi:tetratricopeptide (TPR) repeat protein